MRKLKRFFMVLRRSGLLNMFLGFLACFFAAGFVMFLIEPQVKSYGDGLWFCFVSTTTIGYGDISAVTTAGRIIIVFITIYAIIVTAMIPGVVVGYYTEYLKAKEKDTISTFLEKLEHLPELSDDELKTISERVREFNKNR